MLDISDKHEFEKYLPPVIEYLSKKRNWNLRLAKKKQGQQTLLEHVLVECDAMNNLINLLDLEYSFSNEEKFSLFFAIIAHDSNKETQDFQAYLNQEKNFEICMNEELSREIIPELSELLKVDIKIEEVVASIITHMARERKSPLTALRLVENRAKEEISNRWKKLATLVWFTDDI